MTNSSKVLIYLTLLFNVTIMCRNDELSSTMSWVGCLLKDSELFILFAENSQILLKISVIPILLTFIYLVALNLLVNNQLNSSLWHIIVTLVVGFSLAKGQLISKAKCQAVDSPKKRTNEFAFFDLKSCYVVKSNALRSFFWRNYGLTICFRN